MDSLQLSSLNMGRGWRVTTVVCLLAFTFGFSSCSHKDPTPPASSGAEQKILVSATQAKRNGADGLLVTFRNDGKHRVFLGSWNQWAPCTNWELLQVQAWPQGVKRPVILVPPHDPFAKARTPTLTELLPEGMHTVFLPIANYCSSRGPIRTNRDQTYRVQVVYKGLPQRALETIGQRGAHSSAERVRHALRRKLVAPVVVFSCPARHETRKGETPSEQK